MKDTTRYHLVIPTSLFKEVERAAVEEQVTMLEIFRKCIRIGLMIYKDSKKSNTAVVIKTDGKEREI